MRENGPCARTAWSVNMEVWQSKRSCAEWLTRLKTVLRCRLACVRHDLLALIVMARQADRVQKLCLRKQ